MMVTLNSCDYLPSIYFCHDALRFSFSIRYLEVFPNPCDEMVLVCPLDHLMEQVTRCKLVDIRTWKVISEGL